VLGGEIDTSAPGMFVPVTLVDNPPEDSKLVAEEPIGPILPLLKRIGRQIQAGTVWLNEVHQYTPHQVFGGHKQSGIGAENSLHGLGEYTNWQSITLNKDPDAV